MSSHTPLGTTQRENGTYRFDMATPSSPIPRTCSFLVSAFSTAGRGLTSPAYVTSVGACCTALSQWDVSDGTWEKDWGDKAVGIVGNVRPHSTVCPVV